MNTQNGQSLKPGTFSQRIIAVFTSRAVWFYASVWVASLIYLVASGNGITGSVAFAAGILVFCGLTVVITKDEVDDGQTRIVRPRSVQWLQLAVVILVIGITAYSGYLFNMRPGQSTNIPIWSSIVNMFGKLGSRYLIGIVDHSPALAGANPAKYIVIPLVLLLLLGARFSELGFRRGHRVLLVTGLWVSIPVILFISHLMAGATTLLQLARLFMGHLLRNGFSEEFLFRGAFQTRLRQFMTPDWAIVIQALVFALWHVGFDTQTMGGDVIAGLALGIASHSIFGLAMGIIFYRTRNLVAPSIVHVVINMFSS